jgi:hypothetical protein
MKRRTNTLLKTAGVLCLTLIFATAIAGCRSGSADRHKLQISFRINEPAGVVPSYQTVVWLEDEAGAIIKTLLVSEYLSMGGYNKEGVCPAWSGKSGWNRKEIAEISAVTAATPVVQPQLHTVACSVEGIEPGRYHYFVATHIVKDYNILCRGEITISDKPDTNVAEVTYTPEKHEKGYNALTDVTARYHP